MALHSVHLQPRASEKEGAWHSFLLQILIESLLWDRHISRHWNRPVIKADQTKEKKKSPAFMEIMFCQRDSERSEPPLTFLKEKSVHRSPETMTELPSAKLLNQDLL